MGEGHPKSIQIDATAYATCRFSKHQEKRKRPLRPEESGWKLHRSADETEPLIIIEQQDYGFLIDMPRY